MDLADACVLVTGGGTGIGLATARALAAGGARVAVCGRRKEPLEKARVEFGAVAIVGDVAIEDDAQRIVQTAADAIGDINVLVNNAAIGQFALLLETDVEAMKRVFDVNVFGATVVARECAKLMVKGDGGTIVNVASTAANKGFPGGTIYAASKFALTGLTECWRAELRKHDIRVMQVNPSEVQTGFGGRGEPTKFDESRLRAEDVAHVIVSMITSHDRGFVTDATLWATNPGPRG